MNNFSFFLMAILRFLMVSAINGYLFMILWNNFILKMIPNLNAISFVDGFWIMGILMFIIPTTQSNNE